MAITSLTFETLHEWIVKGLGARARTAILALGKYDVSRENAAQLAQLAWRVNLPEIGLRVLGPIVRPSARSKKTATPEEINEYAQCLVKYGAVEEAERLLEPLDTKKTPAVILTRISAKVSQWRYLETISPLVKMLERKDLDPYQRVVAQANLAAAFVDERMTKEATPILRELLHTCSLRGYALLLGRSLELTAENFVTLRKWKEADAFLDEAKKRLADAGNLDAFFVDKYRAINSLLKTEGSEKSLEEYQVVRSEAGRKKHWETVRDLDRHVAVVKKDPKLFLHVYFGTPWQHYRERLSRDFGPVDSALLSGYEWALKPSKKTGPSLDLAQGKIDEKVTPAKPGSLLQKLLIALSSDFYRAQRMGSLFAKLYPDRVYHPLHSPPLVYNVMFRAREFFESAKLPLKIDEKNGFFNLDATGSFTIRVSLDEMSAKRHGDSLAQLRAEWPREAFSIGQAQLKTGLTRRTLFRLLEAARQDGVLERIGQSKATRYRFRR